jgi:hypothetical protein
MNAARLLRLPLSIRAPTPRQDPYFGLRGDGDAQALHDAYADTIERYRDDVRPRS